MQITDLPYLCKQYEKGLMTYYDYRVMRTRLLHILTSDDEDFTLPVSQIPEMVETDNETTISIGDVSLFKR
jgi:hypothetical protein